MLLGNHSNMTTCQLCGAVLDALTDLEQVDHLNQCLEEKFSPLVEDQTEPTPFPAMPVFEKLPKSEILQLLENFGIKKSLDMSQARSLLKDIWLYQHCNIYPQFLRDN